MDEGPGMGPSKICGATMPDQFSLNLSRVERS
jgi:hypothetical protein